jgi:hypothetical protein
VSVLYSGVCQGSLLAKLPMVNCLYTMSKKTYEATTLTIEPKLLTIFHPV